MMARRSPRKIGTGAEAAVVDYLRGAGFRYAERRALRGAHDEGDITGIPGVVIEVKAVKDQDIAGWLDEAELEGRRAGVGVAVVWHKRRGKGSAGDWYVTMSGDTFAGLLRGVGFGQ